jgi:hypothetical protein
VTVEHDSDREPGVTANSVKDAFAERDWMNYLVTSAPVATLSPAASDAGDLEHVADPPSFMPHPATSARAKAFLSQSIDYRY